MGISESFPSTKTAQRHRKFIQIFQSNYKLHSRQTQSLFAPCNLYENINTDIVEVLEKILLFENESQIQKALKTMEKRITKPHPNLLRVYDMQYLEQQHLCSSAKAVRVYTEYLQKTLKNQLSKRRKSGSYLSQSLLLKIVVSLLNGIAYLHEQNTFHGEIRAQNVLLDGSYHLKLVEKAMLSPSNWQIVAAGNMEFKILRGKGVLLSPCILDCLKHKTAQMANYDPFKADIFAIGMILLECCSLKKAEDFYDYQNLTVKQKQIEKVIYQCRKKYPNNIIMNLIQKMLQIEDEDRPSAAMLMSQMQGISGETLREMNTTLNESFLSQTIRSYL